MSMRDADIECWLPLTPAMFFILLSLSDEAKHGYAIMQEVTLLSDNKVRMGPATLYTTIQRLLTHRFVVEVTREGESDQRRRYYELTRPGRRLLEAEIARMDSVVRLARKRKLA